MFQDGNILRVHSRFSFLVSRFLGELGVSQREQYSTRGEQSHGNGAAAEVEAAPEKRTALVLARLPFHRPSPYDKHSRQVGFPRGLPDNDNDNQNHPLQPLLRHCQHTRHLVNTAISNVETNAKSFAEMSVNEIV